ncbi:hypothetical protein TRVL_08750 [Trypanosoma vivax]|nr:hypothetical protein TRVL_08750 [Trypanosoma vivax]
MAKLPCAPSKAVDKDKAPRPLFNGHSILRRARITRAAAEQEQRRLPLQGVNLGALPLQCARRRLNSEALRCFDVVWRNALRSPEPHPSSHEPNLRIGEPDAKEMDRVGVVRKASQ